MSSNQCADKCTSEASYSPEGKGIALQSASVVGSLKADVVDQDGVLNNVSKTNKKVRKKKPKVNKVRSATGSTNKRKTKRRKKVGNSNLKMLPDESGTQITDETKKNFEAPWQSYNSTDLGNFASTETSGFNEQEPKHNAGQNQIEAEQKIQNKQKNSFFEELNDIALKFEHFALLVEEYFLVLDSLKS